LLKVSGKYLDGNILDIETNVISWETLGQGLVMHLDRLDLSLDTRWGKVDDHSWLDDSGLDSADWHSTNSTNLVDILKRKTQWLVGWSTWWLNGVNGLEKGLSRGGSSLGLLGPSLVPSHVLRWLNHVISVPSRDGDKGNSLGVISDLLDESRHLLDNLEETRLTVLGGIHLVDRDNQLSYTEGVGQESVLTGLSILGDTSLKLTSSTSNDENGAISLKKELA
jgi:hypothetical protein